jgi:hypothetical protein
MSHPRVKDALALCELMQQLLLQHSGGRPDTDALTQFRELSFAASRAADDPECAGMMRSADRYVLDLFSHSAHQSWATPELSGTEFLRLQISRVLDAFRDRLLHLHTAGQSLETSAPSAPKRRAHSQRQARGVHTQSSRTSTSLLSKLKSSIQHLLIGRSRNPRDWPS